MTASSIEWGDENDREARVVPKLQKFLLHLAARQCIECGKRFVHQQDVGFHGHGPGDGHALFHAARQHVRIGVFEAIELHFVNVLGGELLGFVLGLALAAIRQGERDVAHHRFPRQQLVELLEDHATVGPRVPDDVPFQAHLPFDGMQVSRNALQERGFAAARGSQDDEAVGRVGLEAHPVGRGNQVLLGLVLERDTVDVENRLDRRNGGSGSRRFCRQCAVRRHC